MSVNTQNEINPKFDNYEILNKIGEGTYGKVYKAQHMKNKQLVAIKQIKFDHDEEGIPSTALREISLLKQLSSHKNIVKMLDVIYQPLQKKLYLIFEFMEMDLKMFIDNHRKQYDMFDKTTHALVNFVPINKQDIQKITYQILMGLDACHKRRIIHRDMKPQNILIDQQKNAKIADFGLARVFSLPLNVLTHEVETLWYRAPEILLGSKYYGLQLDSWSIGCILYELYAKRPLFQGDSELDQIFKIFRFQGTPTNIEWPGVEEMKDYQCVFPKFVKDKTFQNQVLNGIDPFAKDLILKLIELDPQKRMTIQQALKHQFFQDFMN